MERSTIGAVLVANCSHTLGVTIGAGAAATLASDAAAAAAAAFSAAERCLASSSFRRNSISALLAAAAAAASKRACSRALFCARRALAKAPLTDPSWAGSVGTEPRCVEARRALACASRACA